ncbi:hypothetical protein [Chromobacterium subtsugae]|uniref:hypothetical protein n=1 Tax=Chromobacterium subtsugae TaxID=251747 RepID=UPI000B078690|nr:hypothetical protein [Chromobacterium subtsugae]
MDLKRIFKFIHDSAVLHFNQLYQFLFCLLSSTLLWIIYYIAFHTPYTPYIPWKKNSYSEILEEKEKREVMSCASGLVAKAKSRAEFVISDPQSQQEHLSTLKSNLDKGTYTWNEIFSLELLTLLSASENILEQLYQEHLEVCAFKKHDKNMIKNHKKLRPMLIKSKMEAQSNYLFKVKSEAAIDFLRLRLIVVLTFTTSVLALIMRHYYYDFSYITITLSAIFGLMGSFTSIMRRIQLPPENNIHTIQNRADTTIAMHGSWSLQLALLSGIIFGIVGQYLIASHLLDGIFSRSVLPFFSNNPSLCSMQIPCITDSEQFPKMAAWAYIFGFAEQLIPDLLSQITSHRKIEGKNT